MLRRHAHVERVDIRIGHLDACDASEAPHAAIRGGGAAERATNGRRAMRPRVSRMKRVSPRRQASSAWAEHAHPLTDGRLPRPRPDRGSTASDGPLAAYAGRSRRAPHPPREDAPRDVGESTVYDRLCAEMSVTREDLPREAIQRLRVSFFLSFGASGRTGKARRRYATAQRHAGAGVTRLYFSTACARLPHSQTS